MNETKQIQVAFELIGPDKASELLGGNFDNRKVKQRVVSRYAQMMALGDWKGYTAEPIKISQTGRLLDGQHRLLAVISSKKDVEFMVVRNVPEDVFEVIDTGAKRSSGDVFQISGIKYANMIPSIIAYYFGLDSSKSKFTDSINCNNSVLLREYESNPEFWDEVALKTQRWYDNFAKILPPSIFGGCYAFLYKKYGDLVELFFDQLSLGLDVTNNSISVLRNVLIKDKTGTKKLHKKAKLALIIKTWNAYKTGDVIKRLYYVPENETYPEFL